MIMLPRPFQRKLLGWLLLCVVGSIPGCMWAMPFGWHWFTTWAMSFAGTLGITTLILAAFYLIEEKSQ